jgi:hypothetical protein
MVNTLKAELSSVKVQQVAGLAPGTLDLIIGSTFTGLHGSATSGGTATAGNSTSPSSPSSS